jgi:hypothetical protein
MDTSAATDPATLLDTPIAGDKPLAACLATQDPAAAHFGQTSERLAPLPRYVTFQQFRI